jgi:hypothetical protein
VDTVIPYCMVSMQYRVGKTDYAPTSSQTKRMVYSMSCGRYTTVVSAVVRNLGTRDKLFTMCLHENRDGHLRGMDGRCPKLNGHSQIWHIYCDFARLGKCQPRYVTDLAGHTVTTLVTHVHLQAPPSRSAAHPVQLPCSGQIVKRSWRRIGLRVIENIV